MSKNTTRARVTVRVCLSRIDVIIPRNSMILSQVKPVNKFNCFSASEKSPILSRIVVSYSTLRPCNKTDNSGTLSSVKFEYVSKRSRSKSKKRFLIRCSRQHRLSSAMNIFFFNVGLYASFLWNYC